MNHNERVTGACEIRRQANPDFIGHRDIGTGMAALNIGEWTIHFEAGAATGARTFLIVEHSDAEAANALEHAWRRAGFEIASSVDVEPWNPTHEIVARLSGENNMGIGFGLQPSGSVDIERRVLSGSDVITKRLMAVASPDSAGTFALRVSVQKPGERYPGETVASSTSGDPGEDVDGRFVCDLRIELDLSEADGIHETEFIHALEHNEPWTLELRPVGEAPERSGIACQLGRLDRVIPLPVAGQPDPATSWHVGNDAMTGSPFRVANDIRFQHIQILGKTGTGKSVYMAHQAMQDIERGDGVVLIDFHGDTVDSILSSIPGRRADDVVVINPGDVSRVTGINLLEARTDTQRRAVIEFVVKFIYDFFDPTRSGIVGPRFETWLRHSELLFQAAGEPHSLLDLATPYTDPAVRKFLLKGIDEPYLIEFWRGEFAKTSDYHLSEILGWFRSKFEVFRQSDVVRPFLGQSDTAFSFAEAMNEGKIVLVDLSKGRIGEHNARLLGHIVVAVLWIAALERATIPISQRNPTSVYIDEFQNAAGPALSEMIAEMRKFHVSLTVANQFSSQLNPRVAAAIQGNIGTQVVFRLGREDAHLIADTLGVPPQLLMELPTGTALISTPGATTNPITIVRIPYTGTTIDHERVAMIRSRSAERWGRPIAEVEHEIRNRWSAIEGSFANPTKPNPTPSFNRLLRSLDDAEEAS